MTPAELSRLYDAHAGSVFAFALNLTRDRDAARDVLQEVFLRLAQQPETRPPVDDTEARSWLFRITHRRIIDQSRRTGTRARLIERISQEPAALFAPGPDPDAAAFQTAVAGALRELPEEQRAVVHLKLWENFSFSQIAAALEISPNTAASRYRYALDKLQSCLRPLYDEIR